jgi:hypothetical protein
MGLEDDTPKYGSLEAGKTTEQEVISLIFLQSSFLDEDHKKLIPEITSVFL